MANGDKKLAILEKKASEVKDNFVVVLRTLEEREATLCAKKAQLVEVLDRLRTLEEKFATEARELRLVSTDLHQYLNAEEEEG